MIPLLLLGALPVDAEITADVDDDLRRVRVQARFVVDTSTHGLGVVLAADRYAEVRDLPPGTDRTIFPRSVSLGGFEDVSVSVDGQPCRAKRVALRDGSHFLGCPAGRRYEMAATLIVPERYGPFGRIGRQLTLAAGWYPYLAPQDGPPPKARYRVNVTVPNDQGVVIGSELFAPGARRRSHVETAHQVPLIVLPRFAVVKPAGRFRHVLRPPLSDGDRTRAKEVLDVLVDGQRFLREEGRSIPKVLVVEAPLRRTLARTTEGCVLISDRAFRVTPFDRMEAFHHYPVLRELFTHVELAQQPRVDAEAIGGWRTDRYVRSRVGVAEDAFDILNLWSFIPQVDSILYAPQLPFVGAYFRLIKEEDPLAANLIDHPDATPPGKVVYEKLLDRLGAAETDRRFTAAQDGDLDAEIEAALGTEAAARFLETWKRPYPDVRYALVDYESAPCGAQHCAIVRISRDGDVIEEPIQVRLEDDDGAVRHVWAAATDAQVRTLTATLATPLYSVEIDPFGRLAETPSDDVPSPKLDNLSHKRWRVLLNSLNVALAATARQYNLGADVGFSRVRDITWRFALNGLVSPSSIALSGRVARGFGPAVTPNRLSAWFGLAVGAEYLRPEFTESSERGFAVSGAAFLGYDDRQTLWAPEEGTGFRLVVDYSRVFGDSGDPDATDDALAVDARFLRSFRFDASHQISVRIMAGAYVYGRPREQLLYSLGGQTNVRGYDLGAIQGRVRGVASAEWVHDLVTGQSEDFLKLFWMSGIGGALFADVSVIADGFSEAVDGPVFGDVGYGLRFYFDYFGVQPGIMAFDVAVPLVDENGRFQVGSPAVYLYFTQSFLIF